MITLTADINLFDLVERYMRSLPDCENKRKAQRYICEAVLLLKSVEDFVILSEGGEAPGNIHIAKLA
jgi:hypothetical protein